jgi:hypothetical protein
MQALEKLTLAYLALQERAAKLEADKDAMFFENQTLLHKSKDLAACNRFLQEERDNLAKQVETLKSAYKLSQQFQNSIEKESSAQNEQIANLKACIEELEGQLVALTPKEQRIDEPKDGYEAEKRVCRAGFKASETPNDADEILYTLKDADGYYLKSVIDTNKSVFGATRQDALYFKYHYDVDYFKFWYNDENHNKRCEVAEVCSIDLINPRIYSSAVQKASDTDEKPVILLANQYGDWVHGKTLNAKEQTELLFTPNKQLADQFASLDEVADFLDDYPLDKINISYRHPKTLKPVNVVSVTTEQPAADEKPELYHTIYDNPA